MLGVAKRLSFEVSRGKFVAMGGATALALSLILLGALGGGPTGDAKGKSGEKPTPRTQLGHAPESEIFNQAYQVRLEHMVHEQMQSFRSELDSRERAREARDSAQMERLTRMVNDWPTHGPSTAQPAASAIPNLPEPPKYIVLRSGIHSSNEPVGVISPEHVPGSLNHVAFHPSEMPSLAPSQSEADPYVLPQDGWAEGRLINGVVTTQGGEFRYAQIKLHGLYHSANDYEHDIDGCVVLGEGTADVAAGRINIKPIKLTCTLPNSRTKTWQTAGYVVDSRDGIQGIAATLVNGGEGKLAASTAAGLIQGGGTFYAQRSVTSTFSPVTGATASILTGNPVNALAGGAVDGAGRALGQEVQAYYSAFRPTVQTGGGITVVVFLTTPMSLPPGGDAISSVRAAK